MIGLLTAFHVLVGVVLILSVLLQSARGADLAGAFGGMGSQTAFGPRGTATFLSKLTVSLAITFMVTSVSLAILSNRIRGTGGTSVLSGEKAAPAQPGKPAAPPPGTLPLPGIPGGGVQVQTAPAPTPATPGQPPVQVPTQTAPAQANPPAPAAPPAPPPASPPASAPNP